MAGLANHRAKPPTTAQRHSRCDVGIDPRLRLVQRLEEFTGLYPWQWTPAEGEAFIAHLRSGTQPIHMSTGRTYEVTISLPGVLARPALRVDRDLPGEIR
jgi:hypothetical protein